MIRSMKFFISALASIIIFASCTKDTSVEFPTNPTACTRCTFFPICDSVIFYTYNDTTGTNIVETTEKYQHYTFDYGLQTPDRYRDSIAPEGLFEKILQKTTLSTSLVNATFDTLYQNCDNGVVSFLRKTNNK